MKNTKRILTAICAVFLVAVSVIGTVAYLTHKTEAVNNTFTVGKLIEKDGKFELKEHKATDEDKNGVYVLDTETEVLKNEYIVLPGVDIPKDPFVKTTEKLELDAYVFVEVVNKFGTALSYTVDETKWTKLDKAVGPNEGTVYYQLAQAGTKLNIPILKKNNDGYEIDVENAEFEDAEDAAKKFGGNLEFYGYMIQAGTFKDAAEAWSEGFEEKKVE